MWISHVLQRPSVQIYDHGQIFEASIQKYHCAIPSSYHS
jgi:hypothetical protein